MNRGARSRRCLLLPPKLLTLTTVPTSSPEVPLCTTTRVACAASGCHDARVRPRGSAALLGALAVLAGCSGSTHSQSATAPVVTMPSHAVPGPPSQVAVSTPVTPAPAGVPAATVGRVKGFELSRSPSGYGKPQVEVGPDFVRVTYQRLGYRGTAPGDPLRVSVQTTVGVRLSDLIGTYAQLGTARVHGATAIYFIVSAERHDPHARHGLTWSSAPDVRVTVYAFTGETQLLTYARSAVASPWTT